MRRFELHRYSGPPGAGWGVVAEGVAYSDGRGSTHFLGEYPSTTAWENVGHAEHIHMHDGATRWVWLDPQAEHVDATEPQASCLVVGPPVCRERPEHDHCRRERDCKFDPDHAGIHSWEPW